MFAFVVMHEFGKDNNRNTTNKMRQNKTKQNNQNLLIGFVMREKWVS